MTAQEAFNNLDPQKWANTSVLERLALLEQVQHNLRKYAVELGDVDAKMKNDLIGENITSTAEGMGTTVMPMANTLMGIHKFYESLVEGKMQEPLSIKEIDTNLFEVQVFPIHSKDKMANQPCRQASRCHSRIRSW